MKTVTEDNAQLLYRVLEWGRKENDEIEGEEELVTLTLSDLRDLFGVQPEDPFFVNSYRVEERHLARIQNLASTRIDLQTNDYYVSCFSPDARNRD